MNRTQLVKLKLKVQVGITLPVQTAICERGFSCQNNMKTAHRNRLIESSFQTLMTIHIEGPPLSQFNPNRALEEFKTPKNRIFQKMTF